MLGIILEVKEEGRKLSIDRGLVSISYKDNTSNKDIECGRVPVDTIEAVIISAHNSLITRPFLVGLAEHNIPLIICDNSYKPVSIASAYSVHSMAGKRMRMQAAAPSPINKGLWKALIKEKIYNQAKVLEYHNPEHKYIEKLEILSSKVLSGDSTCKEGQAARLYWHSLTDKNIKNTFVRDQDLEDENILFNYVYTVLRTSIIRSIIGSGLHPALGVYHSHPLNPFALADDLMEPLRPLADHFVLSILEEYYKQDLSIELSPKVKKYLASILRYEVEFEREAKVLSSIPLYQALHNMSLTVAKSYMEKNLCVKFPKLILRQID